MERQDDICAVKCNIRLTETWAELPWGLKQCFEYDSANWVKLKKCHKTLLTINPLSKRLLFSASLCISPDSCIDLNAICILLSLSWTHATVRNCPPTANVTSCPQHCGKWLTGRNSEPLTERFSINSHLVKLSERCCCALEREVNPSLHPLMWCSLCVQSQKHTRTLKTYHIYSRCSSEREMKHASQFVHFYITDEKSIAINPLNWYTWRTCTY